MKIYDLTHYIEEDISVYCEEERPDIGELATIENEGYNVTEININSHTGTHVDMPKHIFENGKSLDELENYKLFGKAFVLDCVKKEKITESYILENIKEIDKYNYIILKTNADRHWKNQKYIYDYSYLSIEATKYLADLKNLYGVGIDAISIDASSSEELENHKILLEKDKLIIENLCGLKELDGEYNIVVAPLKVRGVDGAPARIILISE